MNRNALPKTVKNAQKQDLFTPKKLLDFVIVKKY